MNKVEVNLLVLVQNYRIILSVEADAEAESSTGLVTTVSAGDAAIVPSCPLWPSNSNDILNNSIFEQKHYLKKEILNRKTKSIDTDRNIER